MPWIQRIALTLLAFGFAGLGLITWQPSGLATTPSNSAAYDLAISSGTGLLLSEKAAPFPAQTALLSCDKVFNLGRVSIGARCIGHDREVSVQD